MILRLWNLIWFDWERVNKVMILSVYNEIKKEVDADADCVFS